METINKIVITKLAFPLDNRYHFNICIVTSVDGGKNFYYCGLGKYAVDEADVVKKTEALKMKYSAQIVEDEEVII